MSLVFNLLILHNFNAALANNFPIITFNLVISSMRASLAEEFLRIAFLTAGEIGYDLKLITSIAVSIPLPEICNKTASIPSTEVPERSPIASFFFLAEYVNNLFIYQIYRKIFKEYTP